MLTDNSFENNHLNISVEDLQTELHASEFHALADPGKDHQEQMYFDPYLVLLFVGLLFMAIALRTLLAS